MMIFKVGKYYKHIGTGELLHIVGEVTTTMYGNCLVGEVTNNYDLIPVGKTKDNTINFVEILEESIDLWIDFKLIPYLNPALLTWYCFLLKYKEYYFFSVDGKCRIYHAKNGIVRECELGFIWFLSNEEVYLIELITNDDNVNEGHVVISSIEGKMLNNFCVPRRDSWNFKRSASSSNHMVLEFLGNWVILHKKPHNIFSATIKPIDDHGRIYYLIQIWDTGKSEDYYLNGFSLYSTITGVLLIYDITRKSSFEFIQKETEYIEDIFL